MLNRKSLIALCCGLALLVAMATLAAPQPALSQMTIPTRTPDPGGGDPDPEPEPTDDNGGGNNPQPTDEPDPTAEPDPTNEPQPPTATAIAPQPTAVPSQAPVTAVPTQGVISTATPIPLVTATQAPLSGTNTPFPTAASGTVVPIATATGESVDTGDVIVAFPADNRPFPQADPCSMPPTFTTLNAVSVYAGPGEDYELAGLIGAEEVRPIVGRAAFTEWWVVQLDRSGRSGWINDDQGIIHGYTGRVPIVTAPDLFGIAPTPGGGAWVPTPDANCSAAEVLASVVTYDSAGDGSEVPPSGKPDSLEGLPESGGSEQAAPGQQADQGNEADPPEIQRVGEPNVVPANPGQSNREAAADPLLEELANTAAPLELPGSSAVQLPNLMPVVGLVLILAAVFIGLFAKKNRSGTGN